MRPLALMLRPRNCFFFLIVFHATECRCNITPSSSVLRDRAIEVAPNPLLGNSNYNNANQYETLFRSSTNHNALINVAGSIIPEMFRGQGEAELMGCHPRNIINRTYI